MDDYDMEDAVAARIAELIREYCYGGHDGEIHAASDAARAILALLPDTITRQAERIAELERALKPCLALLDGLVAESGRDVGYGEEDSFRRGEWFDDGDLADIERARAALASAQSSTTGASDE